MSHDKLKIAARERMAKTGEPYTVARRAVIREQQASLRLAEDQLPPEQEAPRLLQVEREAMRQALDQSAAMKEAVRFVKDQRRADQEAMRLVKDQRRGEQEALRLLQVEREAMRQALDQSAAMKEAERQALSSKRAIADLRRAVSFLPRHPRRRQNQVSGCRV